MLAHNSYKIRVLIKPILHRFKYFLHANSYRLSIGYENCMQIFSKMNGSD